MSTAFSNYNNGPKKNHRKKIVVENKVEIQGDAVYDIIEKLGDDYVYEKNDLNLDSIPKKSFLNTKKNCLRKHCTLLARRKNLCNKHYKEFNSKQCKVCPSKRYKSNTKYCKEHFFALTPCIIDGCTNEIYVVKNRLCFKHYNLLSRENNIKI
jgi:hypothetical protein